MASVSERARARKYTVPVLVLVVALPLPALPLAPLAKCVPAVLPKEVA